MGFRLLPTPNAQRQLAALEENPGDDVQAKAVRKALAYLETNPKHPGLNSKPYKTLNGPNGEKVFEAYAQNKTPGAYRVFWYYGPGTGVITVFDIIPHP